ncbi:hypothetical protein FE257_009326 [Aspergillus nanangensis]|uniref:Uncharacterized protein n=1 Tax=Aspergillus nanangensis TaxID=2582783 RepID=A0AAD4CKE0_ASPNN|nr:hypothetical protein FE257_009326 [Aspergillus nanangensis]
MSPRVDTTPFPVWARDIGSDLKSVPETLSSWDNCMAKSYCKWPGPKYRDDPYNQPPPPPMPPPPANPVYQPSPAPPMYRGQQQVARFDSPKSSTPKINEDALPAMPTWDNAVNRRVEDKDHHNDAMEMEPLNPLNNEPRRMPSASHHGPGYMGVPPVRTNTSSSFYSEARPYDDQSPYGHHSPGVPSPGPISPYDNQPYDHQPYRDYTAGNPWPAGSPSPTAYTPQPQYMAVGTAITRGESPRPIPYRQPSPGFNQMPIGMAVSRSETPRAVPYRQPSPGFNQIPGMAISPSENPNPHGVMPYRQPGFNQAPYDRVMSPSVPSSPPPPFTAVPAPHETTGDPGRPPSLLQSGRKPVPNSYRDV